MKNLIKKIFNKETIVYLIFGVLTTAVNYLAFWLFKSKFGLTTLVANTVAWVVAVLFAFITNKLFVFESKSFKFNILFFELVSFFGARLLSFFFEEGFLAITSHFKINDYLSKAVASIVVIILNYFASKYFIFKKKKTEENNDESERREQ